MKKSGRRLLEFRKLLGSLKVALDIPHVELALKHAWKRLRYDQPGIATTIVDGKKVYETAGEAELQEWLDSTFIATLYYLPSSSELALRVHHYVIEGIGTILFWQCLLQNIASSECDTDVRFGDEHARLPTSLEEILGYTAPATPYQVQQATGILMHYAANLPSIGLASKVGNAPAANCQHMEYCLSRETTAAITRACKTHQLSVTSAVHAACINTNIKHADPASNTARYTTANEYNLRPYLPAPYNTPDRALSVYYATMPFSIGLPASFSNIATKLNEEYWSRLRDHPDVVQLAGHYTRILADMAAATPGFQNGPIARDPIREYGSTMRVEDFILGLDVVLGMSALLIYTFRGIAFGVRTYMEDINRVLSEELLGLSG
ncbi:hypothetical protein BJX99DRAFT_243923 [Aspergillus californicus]